MSNELTVKKAGGSAIAASNYSEPIFYESVKLAPENTFVGSSPVFNTEKVEIHSLFDHVAEHFETTETGSSLIDANLSLVCFKNRSAQEINQLAKRAATVGKVLSKRSKGAHGMAAAFAEVGGWWTVLVGVLVLSGTNAALFFSDATKESGFAVSMVVLNIVVALAVMMFGAMFSEDLFNRESELIDKSNQKLRKIAKKSNRFAVSDELYTFGTGSLVPKLLQDFSNVDGLVKTKLGTSPDPAELQAWCSVVRDFLEFQKDLKNGVPVDLIPLMSEDVQATLIELTERVNILNEEKSLADPNVEEISEAIRAGAKSYILNMETTDL